MSNSLIGTKIATPYAEAFFQLALNVYLDSENPQDFYQLTVDMQSLYDLIISSPELAKFLENPLHSEELKKDVLQKCLQKDLNKNTLNFINLLVDKKRIQYIEQICKKFLDKAYDFVCVKFVQVWSAVPLTEQQTAALTKKLTDMIGPIAMEPYSRQANVRLTMQIDPQLLGGFIIKIDSKIIDCSLKGDIKRLGKQLNVAM
jgi:F-type H+-transporting ATPase subunit delta